uniref:Uncharacterized protein n=1 Tax=Nelumbo nucifera TaxID=4432 RepID=A0A822XGX5_NELNU|nr:TPA_asm: hypothetical protein HUJ06_020940 [Nelumbo nucifera]
MASVNFGWFENWFQKPQNPVPQISFASFNNSLFLKSQDN